MNQDEILKLIKKISPHGKDYVAEAFKNKQVEILYSVLEEENKGVFIKVHSDDCCIFYASFYNEENIEDILDLIDNSISKYLLEENSKELCFNVYGENLKIINLIRKLGFKSDMQGYHMEYIGKGLIESNPSNLIQKGFESIMLDEYVDLFNSSYYQLDIDNGNQINDYSTYREQFQQKLNNLNKSNQVKSFWLKDELVGAYLFEKNYITDIVVKPKFQNRGFGTYLLANCIKTMNRIDPTQKIRLRVTKSNLGAKRLYERNDFLQIASFAEHTHEGKNKKII